jgi:hypothetical protein
MSQSNDVTHERPERVTSRPRTIALRDTTPPFFLSRTFAETAMKTGAIEGLRFWDVLGPMPRLVRAGDETITIDVFGAPTELRAERYVTEDQCGELCLVRRIDEFRDPVLLRVRRDDQFDVQLWAIDAHPPPLDPDGDDHP